MKNVILASMIAGLFAVTSAHAGHKKHEHKKKEKTEMTKENADGSKDHMKKTTEESSEHKDAPATH